jgi:hypothetical protein
LPSGGGTTSASTTGEKEKGGFPWPLLIGALIVLGILAALFLRKKPDSEEKKPAGPAKGKPLPGSIRATLGTAPQSKVVTLSPLTSVSKWALLLGPDQRPTLTDEEKPEGTPLAKVSLDERRRLVLEAETDVLFQNVAGIKADAANPRQLVLMPGDHLVCRVANASAVTQPLRLELMYQDR